jgi:hypothetical protein
MLLLASLSLEVNSSRVVLGYFEDHVFVRVPFIVGSDKVEGFRNGHSLTLFCFNAYTTL